MFEHNRLHHLELFSVPSAPFLGQATVSALLEHCPSLTSLHSPASWGLGLEELEELRTRMARENMVLELGEWAAGGREVGGSFTQHLHLAADNIFWPLYQHNMMSYLDKTVLLPGRLVPS